MSRFLISISVVALLSTAACGNHSCQDAVNSSVACAAKLNSSANLDLQTCNAAACTRKQGYIDCIVDLKCSDVTAYNAAFDTCLTANGCQ